MKYHFLTFLFCLLTIFSCKNEIHISTFGSFNAVIDLEKFSSVIDKAKKIVLDAKIDTLSGAVTLDSETGSLIDTSMTGDFAVNFLDLDDTPGSLGAVGQSVVVNAARDGLIFSGVSAGEGGGSCRRHVRLCMI